MHITKLGMEEREKEEKEMKSFEVLQEKEEAFY